MIISALKFNFWGEKRTLVSRFELLYFPFKRKFAEIMPTKAYRVNAKNQSED